MPNTLKILSWNIQKFGEDKINDSNFKKYVAKVIQLAQADVVGIMELVGWLGNEAKLGLVAELNNLEKGSGSGITWSGEASEMTPSRPDEQYLFLWKNGLFVGNPMWTLLNVFGEATFDSFFTKYKYTQPQAKENFWQSLFKNGYLDAAFMLNISQSEQLIKNSQNLDLTKQKPKIILSKLQKQEIVDVLTKEKPGAFPLRGSRPPFLLSVNAKPAGTAITIMLFHAPGPGDALPIIASNQLSFVPSLQTANVGVVMGDFNINSDTAQKNYSLQYFDFTAKKLAYVKGPKGGYIRGAPFQRLTGGPFTAQASNPSLSFVLNYSKLLWTDKTSIARTLVSPTTIADNNSIQGVLINEYDKFFVRIPKANFISTAYVFQLIDAMVPKKVQNGVKNGKPIMVDRSKTATDYSSDLARLGAEVFNEWWKRQMNKNKKSAATTKLLAQISPMVTPTSLFQAHYIYYFAISDHLPIVMELQYA